MRAGSHLHERHSGFTLIIILALLASLSLGLAIAGPSFAHQVQREREQELLRVGSMYVEALERYYDNAPGNLRQYPKELEYLTLDTRYVGIVRYLRRLYPDPMQPDKPWGLILDKDGFILGVYSTSMQAPIAKGPIVTSAVSLPAATHYADWQFLVKIKS